MTVLVFQVSEAMSRLRRETYNHPKLREEIIAAMQAGVNASTLIFSETADKDVVMIRNVQEFVGFLAAKEGILVHGLYSQEDIDKLCDMIRKSLEERRTIVLNSSSIILH